MDRPMDDVSGKDESDEQTCRLHIEIREAEA